MTSAAEALSRWRAARNLPHLASAAPRWRPLAGWGLSLPNFRWRADALDRHDLHHMLTDIPCTLKGECRVAAWEFGAGAYPVFAARAFCVPLVLLGFVRAPRIIWASFRRGRSQRSLYSLTLGPETSLSDLEAHIRMRPRRTALFADVMRFAGWLAFAASLTLAPPAALLFFVL